MVMVKLKMRAIYKSFLSLIGFLIFVATLLGVSYLFYDKVLENDSDIEVNGTLSINYVDGKKFDVKDKSSIKFSITNSGDKVSYYNIGFLQVRGNGNYKIKYENSIVTEGTLKSIDEITTDFISIDVGETKVYTLELENNGTSNLIGLLNIRDQEGKIKTFADTILNNITPSESSLTKVGDEIALEDEGLIKNYDDIGVSYNFRGNVKNNYVSFGGLTWRIVRINGDGTVRLVLDGVTDSLTSYYDTNTAEYVFKDSPMEKYLNEWLEINLKDYTNYIANTRYCNDVVHDDIFNYNSYTRILTNKIPTLNCLGESFNSNIGILTIDEVILAGASPFTSNQNYYLYNSLINDTWYTLSGAKGTDSSINMFMVDVSGNIKTDINGNLYRNVRPVINLIKNIEMQGKGTETDPYKMVE